MDIQELLVSFDQNTVEFTDIPSKTTSVIEVEEGNSDLEYFYATSEVNMDKADVELHKLVNPVGEIIISKPTNSTNFDKYKLNLIGSVDSVAKVYNGIYFRSLLPYKSVGDKRDINIASTATLSSYEPNGLGDGSSAIDVIVDGLTTSIWNPYTSETENCKAIFEFDTITSVEYVEVTGYADDNGYAPYDWKITGSDDGITWNLVHVVSWDSNSRENNIGEVRTPERSDDVPSTVRLDTTTNYKFYAIEFINNNNSIWTTIPVIEIKLFEKSEIYTKFYNTELIDLPELTFIFENVTNVDLYTSTLTDWYMSYSLDNNNFTNMVEVSYNKSFSGTFDNLINPAIYTINNIEFDGGANIGNLFDGETATFVPWDSDNDYFELTVENSFRIWAKTSTTLHDSKLYIMQKDVDGDWIPTTAGITNKNRQLDIFELASERLAPGSYRFYASDDYSTGGFKNQRTDTEWFIERELELKEWDFVNLSARTVFFKSESSNYDIDFFNHRKPETIATVPKLFVTESPNDFIPELHFDSNVVLAMPLATDLSFYKGGAGFNTSSVGVTFVEDEKFGSCAKFSDIDTSAKITVDPSANLSYTTWTFSFNAKRDDGYQSWLDSMLMSIVGDTAISEFFSQIKRPIFREQQTTGTNLEEYSNGLIDNLNNTPNIWRNIILTCNLSVEKDEGTNQIISLYIDGINEATFQIRDRNSYTLSIYKILLGGYDSNGHAFNGGYMKDFIFYNRGFNETDEITKLLNNQLTYVEKPTKQLVVDLVDIETGTITYNIEKCDTTHLEIDYDENNVSKLDFNFKTVNTEILESKELDTTNPEIHYYNKTDVWKYDIKVENDLVDMNDVTVISSGSISSTSDIDSLIIIDFNIFLITTKVEEDGIFTYTFDGDTHLPQNFKYIANPVLIDRIIGEDSTALTMLDNKQIMRQSTNNLSYFFQPADGVAWFGFTPTINVSVVDILGYQFVAETKFIATEEIPLNSLVLNDLDDSFKVIDVEPSGTRLLYTVEPYKVRENIVDINGTTLRDETNITNLSGWSIGGTRSMNNQIMHSLEGKQKNTINFDIQDDIETITVSFRYYSLDNWDDNLNDYGFCNVNGIQKWMSKRNGAVGFEDYNSGYTDRAYNLKYYKDITIQLSKEDITRLNGKLTIDVGIHHHSDETTGSGGFNNFKVSATKAYDTQNLKRLPFNTYKVTGTKLDEEDLLLEDIINYNTSFPNVEVQYKDYMMTADDYTVDITRETEDSFNKISLETIRKI